MAKSCCSLRVPSSKGSTITITSRQPTSQRHVFRLDSGVVGCIVCVVFQCSFRCPVNLLPRPVACFFFHEDVERCSNGVPGVESTGICCRGECGTCGGTGCSTRVAGYGQYDCCVGPISRTGASCGDSVAAPCIIGEGGHKYTVYSITSRNLNERELTWCFDYGI